MFSNFPRAQCPKKDSDLYITLMQVQYICWVHSRSQQDYWSEGLSTYIEIFSRKKTVFSPVKNTSKIFFDFFTFILCNFLVRTLQYFQKILNLFFAHENIKKRASKVAHNWPQ